MLIGLLAIPAAARAADPSEPGPWVSKPDHRHRELAPRPPGGPGFDLMPGSTTGIMFSNRLEALTVATNRLLEIGSGVALGDVDGDGRVDVYFSGLENGNALYRNLGQWRFEDITAKAGVACPQQFSTGCALVDLDGDRDLDLLVNGLGAGTRAFLNDGAGVFTERKDLGFFRAFGATSLAIGDLDLDGDLDVYVTNYRTDTFFDNPRGLRMETRRLPDGSQVLEPRERFLALPTPEGVPLVLERGEPDVLYINRGGGTFVPITWTSGVFADEAGNPLTSTPTDWGLAAMFRDMNQDGWPDLYVCNDFIRWPDRIWYNDGGRRYRAAPPTAVRTVSLASMAVDFADINRDGIDDFIVADMLSPVREHRAWQRPDTLAGKVVWPVEDPLFRPEAPRNTLHIGRGDGTYAEIALLAGVAATDWTPNLAFLDVDLDGWEDLLVATGNPHDVQDVDALARQAQNRGQNTPESRRQDRALLPPRRTPMRAYRNQHDLTFSETGQAWGFHQPGFAQGMALADLDDDGDLDVVLNTMNEPARLYRNNATAPRLTIRARGQRQNSRGIGARIVVRGGPVTQSQELIAGGRYASSDDAQRTFATGVAAELTLEVHWPGGHTTVVNGAGPNRLYEIFEPAPVRNPAVPARPAPLFQDASAAISHRHVDSPFDDFARHPLLHRKLSSSGPGITWADLDGDGQDELLIPGGRNGRAVILARTRNGTFAESQAGTLPPANARDQSVLLVDHTADGAPRAWVGEFPWEEPVGSSNTPSLLAYRLAGTQRVEPLPAPSTAPPAVGALALADVDLDGDLDLFAGSRVVPGRYPEASPSMIFLNQDGNYAPGPALPAVGRVSGAAFLDFDADGDPDLALACEWGPVRLLRNDQGTFIDATEASGLAGFSGWWNGIAAGDFDGDGRMDLAASNWGLNWRSDSGAVGTPGPVKLYYGDFSGDGSLHSLLASLDAARSKVTPWRERAALVRVIPSLAARYPTHRAYGAASIEEILQDTPNLGSLEADSFASAVFLNRPSGWVRRPLPTAAQVAPAFGISVADFDGDGREDLFLAQNFLGVDAESSRQDAGTGLVLLGQGQGEFQPLRPLESGIAIEGEQRGAAVSDFDGDGRVDLAVGQHRGPVRLFRNQTGRPGVRIRMRGPAGNPDGAGAEVQLRFEDRIGPARMIGLGTGFASQNSMTTVLGAPTAPRAVRVRWPGRREFQEWPWPAGARAVTVREGGVEAADRETPLRASPAL